MTGHGNAAIRDRCTALAGIFQASRLVQQTGRAEKRDAIATTASINSIFNTAPETAAAVYGNPGALRIGLEALKSQLDNNSGKRDLELAGYVIALMHLERKLGRQSDLMDRIATGIDKVKAQAEYFDREHAAVIAGLADVYKETVSTLHPRIMVKGDESVLSNTSSQNMIRALLLAGVRATVLWSQCGGSRIKLIFQRKALLECCTRMLEAAKHTI
ncbi:MAG: high frequency lysogenization protein HflD [Xanthomonadales bacterium]|nr:high frequency lysogenization protein HflD [Xanthomonadales bacterium]MDX2448778.1 high frequency lysogenization protein HflD [Desulfobacterales bacterium]